MDLRIATVRIPLSNIIFGEKQGNYHEYYPLKCRKLHLIKSNISKFLEGLGTHLENVSVITFF